MQLPGPLPLPAQPIDGFPGDTCRDRVGSLELAVGDVVPVRLEHRHQAAAGALDGQDGVFVPV
jgi:hypothetical protein